MGNCYRVPRRGGSRKDVSAAYRPTSAYNKSDSSAFMGHSQVSSHNAYIGSVSRRAVSSSTSLQHISEREPDGESALFSILGPDWGSDRSHVGLRDTESTRATLSHSNCSNLTVTQVR